MTKNIICLDSTRDCVDTVLCADVYSADETQLAEGVRMYVASGGKGRGGRRKEGKKKE